ncbi:Gfo/Idh/MocA family oxidoreductase [Pantoea coffeiphila]|uniref:Gfo/Idh/MocA family oxidoreductase n=1 Tax=Pantoea coffeiphila TaxID=1465635 RepID=UPI00196020B1|nr:putative dehydrogenase [Pantoea coffeiphila]
MKIAIIGLGLRLGYVARIFSELVPNLEIVGYADPEPVGLPYTKEFGVNTGKAFSAIDELLAVPDLDLVLIGSPNHLHLEHITAALEAGHRVLCEKPIVATEEQTLALARLIHRFGADRILVGLVMRYTPLYADLKALKTNGTLGEISSIEASEHIPPYHGAFFMRDWRRYEKYSGGFLLEKCCHDLDIYQGIVGARAVRVASFGGRKLFVPENAALEREDIHHSKPAGWQGSTAVFDNDGDIVDYQTAIIAYQNGATMAFHANLNVPDLFRRFCIVGTTATAEGDFIRNTLQVHRSPDGEKIVDNHHYSRTELGHHYGGDERMVKDIVDHLLHNQPLPVSVIDALEAGLTAIKIDEARRSGSLLDLTESWRRFDAALNGEV